MEETPVASSGFKLHAPEPEPATPVAPRRAPGRVLSFVVGLVGVAALFAAGWVYTETQRDIARLSTDIAQIKLSLELFGRQQAADSPASIPDDAGLQDLSNRLAILEESWRSGAANTQNPTLPALAGETTAPAATAASDGDCLPTGTRFMVAAGDNYTVCGTTGTVEIGAVENGFISLADGTVIAQGGNIGLPGTQCMIAVLPSEGGSISGFAEIRVTC